MESMCIIMFNFVKFKFNYGFIVIATVFSSLGRGSLKWRWVLQVFFSRESIINGGPSTLQETQLVSVLTIEQYTGMVYV